MCPIRFGRPVEPEVSSHRRPSSGSRGSVAALHVVAVDHVEARVEQLRAEVLLHPAARDHQELRAGAGVRPDGGERVERGGRHDRGRGRQLEVRAGPPRSSSRPVRTSTRALPAPGARRRPAGVHWLALTAASGLLDLGEQVEHVGDGGDLAQSGGVEVELLVDLVLDAQRQLGEVQRAEADLLQVRGLVGGQRLALRLEDLAPSGRAAARGRQHSCAADYRCPRQAADGEEDACCAQQTNATWTRCASGATSPPTARSACTSTRSAVDEHSGWWSRVKDDPARRVLVFEYDGRMLGIVNFFDLELDGPTRTGAWGFFLDHETTTLGGHRDDGVDAGDEGGDRVTPSPTSRTAWRSTCSPGRSSPATTPYAP